MDFDAMRQTWESQDKKLDAAVRLNTELLRRGVLEKADSAMGRQFRELLFEVILNGGALLLLGFYIADHFAEIRYVIPAIALDIYVIALNIGLCRQLAAIKAIDYAAPVLAIQKELQRLAIMQITSVKWTLLFCPLMWVPLQIVAFQILFGVDVYAYFGTGYLVANVLFGLAVIPIAVWLSRRFGGRLGQWPLMRSIASTIVGANFKAATGHLDELARFESPALADSP